MKTDDPQSDTARIPAIEPNKDWPERVEIVLHWPKGRRSAQTITAEQFFGDKNHGAPLTGDALISMIERLRRTGAPKA